MIVAAGARPADAALREYLGRKPYLAPAEKRAITRAVFAYFRWLRWAAPKEPLPKRIEHASHLQDRFDHDPNAVRDEALCALALPDWVKQEFEPTADFYRQIQREPPLWIRSRPGTGEVLARRLGNTASLPGQFPAVRETGPSHASDALIYTGEKDLFLTGEFRAGAFEIQDLASQWVGWVCAPRPGETWLDACAGEGGKTLHLADLMGNQGVVWATDRSARRLDILKRRAARAKLFNIRVAPRPPRGPLFDGVLVDAPCSGIGTWQRNPHARWTTAPSDVAELAKIQIDLLAAAAAHLKPGGRLVFSVCTLTRSETTAVAAAFTAAHPNFVPLPVALPGSAPAPSSPATLWPQHFGSNGMFVAAWRRP